MHMYHNHQDIDFFICCRALDPIPLKPTARSVRGEVPKGRLGARAQRDVAGLAADRAAATPNLRVSFLVWGRYVSASLLQLICCQLLCLLGSL